MTQNFGRWKLLRICAAFSFIFFVLGLDSHGAGCTCWLMAANANKMTSVADPEGLLKMA
jgi:hypothetical protein